MSNIIATSNNNNINNINTPLKSMSVGSSPWVNRGTAYTFTVVNRQAFRAIKRGSVWQTDTCSFLGGVSLPWEALGSESYPTKAAAKAAIVAAIKAKNY